jgi:hypothetical protein
MYDHRGHCCLPVVETFSAVSVSRGNISDIPVLEPEPDGPAVLMSTPLSQHCIVGKGELPKQMRFHHLHQSCATLLRAQGVHPRVIVETLGHIQISTTMNTHTHVFSHIQ